MFARTDSDWRRLICRVLLALALPAVVSGQARAQLGKIEVVEVPNRPGFGLPSAVPTGPAQRVSESALHMPLLGAPVPMDPPPVPLAVSVAPADDAVVQKGGEAAGKVGDDYNPALQLKPPPPELLFRLESEQALRSRIRKEALANPKLPSPEFPDDKPAPGYLARRDWPLYTWLVEPAYLCHGRLFFEQRQAERYGLDLGVIHPIWSTGLFVTDVAIFPVRAAVWPSHPYECHIEEGTGFGFPEPSVRNQESGVMIQRVGINFP